jgi:phosphinothricin acetyltransferase
MKARLATIADSTAIARIYNHGLAERTATFETVPRTAADVERWFDERHPIVVIEDGGNVIAFASTSTYRARECYAGIAEFSVYVAAEARRQGAGRLAMEALMQEAERRGFWKLVSRIFVENTASRALMKRLGFRDVGVYEKHGRLDGVWRDVVIVEYLIKTNIDLRGLQDPEGLMKLTDNAQTN